MKRLSSKLTPTDVTIECHPHILKLDSLKVPELLSRLSLRAAYSLATSIRQSLSVTYLWLLSIARLQNIVCVVVERRSQQFFYARYAAPFELTPCRGGGACVSQLMTQRAVLAGTLVHGRPNHAGLVEG